MFGPKDEVCRINLGIAYEALGRADAAIEQYRIVVNNNSKSTFARLNLDRLVREQDAKREIKNAR